jgi:hypothetical protein
MSSGLSVRKEKVEQWCSISLTLKTILKQSAGPVLREKTSGWTRVIYSEQEFIYDEVNLSMTFGLDGFQEERF